jgi:hypothetical protein
VGVVEQAAVIADSAAPRRGHDGCSYLHLCQLLSQWGAVYRHGSIRATESLLVRVGLHVRRYYGGGSGLHACQYLSQWGAVCRRGFIRLPVIIAGGAQVGKEDMDCDAGDQGIILDYASDKTWYLMPFTHSMATRLGQGAHRGAQGRFAMLVTTRWEDTGHNRVSRQGRRPSGAPENPHPGDFHSTREPSMPLRKARRR